MTAAPPAAPRAPVTPLAPTAGDLCLVVPCHNEAHRLPVAAFEAALAAYPWLSLHFVDDGSTDRTGPLLDACAAAAGRARVTVTHLPANRGKAEAVRVGLQRARARTPLVGFCDADLSAPLSEVAHLRAVLLAHPDAEWVWGIRLLSLGRVVERRAARHYLGRLFATATSLALGLRAYDTQCGCKLFRSSRLLDAVLDRPFRSRWIFDVELLVRAETLRRASGGIAALVIEEPLHEWRHRPGSKVRPRDFVRAVAELHAIRSDRARHQRAAPPAGVEAGGRPTA